MRTVATKVASRVITWHMGYGGVPHRSRSNAVTIRDRYTFHTRLPLGCGVILGAQISSEGMLRGTQSNSVPSKWNDLLQSSQGKPLKLEVAYPSFHVPDYTKHVHSLVGRLWAYDNVSGMLVLETGQAPPLPTALRNSPVSAVYEAGTGRAPTSGSLSGFKMICVSEISQADVLSEEAFAKALPDAPAQLTVVPSIPPAVLAAREANAIKKCEERTHQLGPREAGVLGQAVFDALNKTYVPHSYFFAHSPAFLVDGTRLILLFWTRSLLYVGDAYV